MVTLGRKRKSQTEFENHRKAIESAQKWEFSFIRSATVAAIDRGSWRNSTSLTYCNYCRMSANGNVCDVSMLGSRSDGCDGHRTEAVLTAITIGRRSYFMAKTYVSMWIDCVTTAECWSYWISSVCVREIVGTAAQTDGKNGEINANECIEIGNDLLCRCAFYWHLCRIITRFTVHWFSYYCFGCGHRTEYVYGIWIRVGPSSFHGRYAHGRVRLQHDDWNVTVNFRNHLAVIALASRSDYSNSTWRVGFSHEITWNHMKSLAATPITHWAHVEKLSTLCHNHNFRIPSDGTQSLTEKREPRRKWTQSKIQINVCSGSNRVWNTFASFRIRPFAP